MKSFPKYTLIAVALNLLVILAVILIGAKEGLEGFFLGFMIAGIFIVIEIIAALFMLAKEEMKIYGQAMLLSLGIILLIGFSWCGLATMN